MIISDINHIEVVNEETNILGGSRRNFDLYIDKDVRLDIRVDIDKYVDSRVNVKGRLANAEATAEYRGYSNNFLVETDTDSFVYDGGGATSFSNSVVAVDY
ncbi:MAG: hypothetical protein F6J94_27735 [Moorea sp. SIO1F2]|uniref:hypothetical protein n=1 Tax=Moorena sp. SIO1F2 TaxID=2607819 RepID=UPI0013BCFC14|nr:hypothetical protein [Moorena sp. SIO1F2]NET85549.1 hypothetical protein [Moorena sp. SIO1F2]